MYPKKPRFILTSLTLIALLLLSYLLWQGFARMDYSWEFGGLLPYLWSEGHPGLLLQGLWGTFYISALSICFGGCLGFLIGLMMRSRERVVQWTALVYVDVFRNTPVLVQLYVAFFILGTAFSLSPEQAGILTLSLFCAAFVGDIVRGTLANFEHGQIEAAVSLGLSPLQVNRLIVLPQVLRRMLPALVGQFVSLVKDSSLVSVIGLLDITKAAMNVVSVTFKSFEIWFGVAAAYLILNLLLSSFGRLLERRLAGHLQ
jgi:polar amino acid transport system permease protein